jgi:putative ABC transport system permease protein
MIGNRVVNTLLMAFAAVALLLTAVGIYGVVSYTAAQRAHEMGIRAALGAGAGDLRKLIFQEGMTLAAIGLAIGLAGTSAATGALSSMLFGVSALDPLTMAVAAVILSAVAGLACFLPARRITKADPMEVLRS